jgi:uncharacterized membrane protein
MKSSTRRIPTVVLAVTIAATLLTTAFITSNSLLQSVFAQQPQPQPTQQQKAPLNFYLKLANNASTSQAASQAAANGTGTKNMTITVNVQKGPGGQQIPLPISAVVPANIQPQGMQLCASLADGLESCQALSGGGQQAASIDLSQSSAAQGATPAPMGTASPMPAPTPAPPTATTSPMPAPAPQTFPKSDRPVFTNIIDLLMDTITSASIVQYVDAQLIGIEDTTINIPVTVIVPIDLNIQNAQVCASVLSGGDQSCTQVVLNPEQTSYTDVNVDLSSATPTLTTAEQEPTTALTTAEPTATASPAPTTEPTSPTTTTTETAPPTTTTETAPTEEPSTDTGTEEGGTTTEQQPSTEGGTSEGGAE